MRHHDLEVSGLRLSALEWPGEGLPILALHGWLDNAASFIPLGEAMHGYHILALDLPGHGHSDHLPPSAHYHMADNLHIIDALADAMGWRQLILLGHSLGAAIAVLAAAAMPQRVAAICLLDGVGPIALTPQQEVGRLRELFAITGHSQPRRSFPDINMAVRIRQRHGRFAISQSAARLIVERNLRNTAGEWWWRYDEKVKEFSTHYYCEEQVQGILSAIECPAMLLAAEEGALKNWAGFDARVSTLAGLQHVQLPGGHYLHMEAPQRVAEVLIRFIDSLDGGAHAFS